MYYHLIIPQFYVECQFYLRQILEKKNVVIQSYIFDTYRYF